MSKDLTQKERVRPNGTTRACVGKDSKECFRCKKTLDVIHFTPYWFQPIKGGKPNGEKIRKRLASCKECVVKQKKGISQEENTASD